MKPFLHKLLFLVILLSAVLYLPAAAQNFSTRFLDNVNSNSLSVVTVNSSMIEAMKSQISDKKLLEFFDELNFLRVITVKNNRTDAEIYYGASVAMIKKSKDLRSLVSSQEGIHRLQIMMLPAAQGKAKEIVLINYDGNNLTIVNITGNINISNLSELSSSLRKAFQ